MGTYGSETEIKFGSRIYFTAFLFSSYENKPRRNRQGSLLDTNILEKMNSNWEVDQRDSLESRVVCW